MNYDPKTFLSQWSTSYPQSMLQKRVGTIIDVSEDTKVYHIEGSIPDEDGDIFEGQLRPLIYGYLHKLGRNGKWQRRFFETDGECLTYYKSDKRTKVLASLDLCKVRNKKNQSTCDQWH